MDDAFRIWVDCGEGPRGGAEPRRFVLRGQVFGVLEILDRWPDSDHGYFKVRADDEGIYILRHDRLEERWELTLFASVHRPETRLSST